MELTAAEPGVTKSADRSKLVSSVGKDSPPGHFGDDDDDVDDLADISIIQESMGRLKSKAAATFVDESDDKVLQVGHTDTTSRKHRVSRIALSSQVGKVGRKTTKLAAWSPGYVHLKDRYATFSTEGISGGEVMAGVLQLLSSEEHHLDVPALWANSDDSSLCEV